MNYKKTWFGWISFCVGTLFMGVFLFASLVSMFEFIGITTSLFNIPWLRVSFVVSFAVILGILGIVILWHFVKKRIPISDSLFSNSLSNYVTRIAFVVILTAGIFIRFKLVPDKIEDIVSTKYLEKIMLIFNNGTLTDTDIISNVYCHIGAFFYRVFGTDNFSLFYLNIFFQSFSFIFLFYSIRITFGKTVAIISYIGMFLTSLPLEFVNRITPDSLILFVVSIVILTISLFLNDVASGLLKSNWNFIIFLILAIIQGGLIYINPAFIVIPIYFSVRSVLMVKTDCNDSLVNNRFVTTLFFMGVSNLFVLLSLIIKGLVIHDLGAAFVQYSSNIGWSTFIRFFIYPSEYLITCIVCFAFAFIGFIYFIFSDNDYISAITLLFALLYVIFAKNMIAYDLSFYFVILLVLFMGLGVKRMFFEGYGAINSSIDEFDDINDSIIDDKEMITEYEISKETEMSDANVGVVEAISTNDISKSEENNIDRESKVDSESSFIKENIETNCDISLENGEAVKEEINKKEKDYTKPMLENLDTKDTKILDDKASMIKRDKINFIDNVLPLPKPHVKKTLDYAFEPSASEMKYDYEISEDDDFDLP